MVVVAITEAFYIRGALTYAAAAGSSASPAIWAWSPSMPSSFASKASCGVISKS